MGGTKRKPAERAADVRASQPVVVIPPTGHRSCVVTAIFVFALGVAIGLALLSVITIACGALVLF
jgi:hypothetical protein